MRIDVKNTGGILTVRLTGELDESNAAVVREESDKHIESSSMSSFVYDLKSLRFMDSTGLGVILGRYRKLKARGVPMTLRGANSQVMKVIVTAGLNEIMNIE